MEQGKYEEALQRHIWHFNHALEYDQGQTGVRLSFALSQWVELGRRYPKAKQALLEIRDRDSQLLASGQGFARLFQDVNSINNYLGQEEATVALFKTMREKDPKLADDCYFYVKDVLLKQGEYELLLKCAGDPQSRFEFARSGFESQIKHYQGMAETWKQHPLPAVAPAPPDFSQLATNNFVGQVCKLVEILVATGHQADAEKIQSQALAVLDFPQLQSAVSDASKKLQSKAGQASSAAVSTSTTDSRLVLEAMKYHTYNPESGQLDWGFKCFIPPDHLASFLFVRWTNGVPTVDPGFSTYFKVGKAGGIDLPFCGLSCNRIAEGAGFAKQTDAERLQSMAAWGYPESAGVTNAVRWNVNLGAGSTGSRWIAMPPFHQIETKFPQGVRSGHQRVIPLVEFAGFESAGNYGQSGVELRVFLEPLKLPPTRMLPTEVDQTNYVSGSGLAGTMDETLNKMKNLPVDP